MQHIAFATRQKGNGQIYPTLLLRLCDLEVPQTLILCINMRKLNLSGYITEIQNIFDLLNIFSIREVIKHKRFQYFGQISDRYRSHSSLVQPA